MALSLSSSLAKRILSALVMIPLAVAAVYLGGAVFYALVAAAFGISVYEWSQMCFRKGRPKWSRFMPGFIYIAAACIAIVLMRARPDGLFLVIYLFVAVWASDIGAYVAGRTLKGPRMAPSISPNKTWSGLVGGCIAAAAAVMAVCYYWPDTELSARISALPLWAHGLFGITLGVVGQLGDLLESHFKRRAGVKDSGNIIPGHGGLLDRIDALLMVSIISAACLWLLESLP